MGLINIEYGSLASSETMNKNFVYLEDKIADTSESIMTSISSILSNIATINSRLNDISETMNDSIQNITSTMDEYKTKTKILISKNSMIPDWTNCAEITLPTDKTYEINTNGYLLLSPKGTANNALIINNKTIEFKTKSFTDSIGQIITFPVFKGDLISTKSIFNKSYFVPFKEINIENY